MLIVGCCTLQQNTQMDCTKQARCQAAHTKYLLSLGFEQDRASRCNFQHKGRDIRLTVHGDDFLVVADTEQLAWLDAKLRQQYDMKSEVFGPRSEQKQGV